MLPLLGTRSSLTERWPTDVLLDALHHLAYSSAMSAVYHRFRRRAAA